MIYSLHEKVRYFKPVMNFVAGEKNNLVSGNLFESLATTNPELFNMYKLKQLQHSDSLLQSFNEYFNAILDRDMERYVKTLEDFNNNPDDFEESPFHNRFNVLQYIRIQDDIDKLSKESGLSEEEIIQIMDKNYAPETLSEEGIKKLIRIRIANNRFLVDRLMEMLRNNYTLLDISLAEATIMANNLSNDKTSNSTIGDIRSMFKNPSIISKFKDGNNYDFRPIGGAYICMSHGMDMEGDAPDKHLINIFKYDAIIIAHGAYIRGERIYSLINGVKNNKELISYLIDTLDIILNNEKLGVMDVLPIKYKKMILKFYNEIRTLRDQDINNNKIDIITKRARNIFDRLIELCNDDDLVPWWNRDTIFVAVDGIDAYLQHVLNRTNKDQIELDGKSSEWTCYPVNTLRKKNLTHIIDVVRALKSEGFKNILINVCNPGHVKLPADLRSSLDFKVTMGLHDVMKENHIVQEGIIDNIKSLISSTIDYLKKFKIKTKKEIGQIVLQVSNLIERRLRNAKKLDNPGRVKLLSINNGKCEYIDLDYMDQEELQKGINTSNKSILQLIDYYISKEEKYIRNLHGSKSIFESVEFI